MNRKLILYPRYDQDANYPLMASLESDTPRTVPTLETGDKYPIVLQFCTPSPAGDTLDVVTLEEGDTIALGAKTRRTDTTHLFSLTSWTATTQDGEPAYTATLDLTTIPTTAWQGRDTLEAVTYIQVRDASNTIRYTRSLTLRLNRGINTTDSTGDPQAPYLDTTTADNRYPRYDAPQTLTGPQQNQFRTNTGTVASSGGTLSNATLTGSTTWTLNFWTGTAQIDDETPFTLKLVEGSEFPIIDSTDDATVAAFSLAAGLKLSKLTAATGGLSFFAPDGTTTLATLDANGLQIPSIRVTNTDCGLQIINTEGNPIASLGNGVPSNGLPGFNFSGTGAFAGDLAIGDGQTYLYADGTATIPGAITSFGPFTLYDGSSNPSLGLFAASGAATITGDLWVGPWSGTGQGLLISPSGIYGYNSSSGNTFGLDPDTGTAILTALQINSYTLTLGGNVAFGAAGRTLAATSTIIAANDALQTIGNSIASAATTSIAAATGRAISITGTTNISSFGTATAGPSRILIFSGRLYLIHHATDLILPDGIPLLVQAGDVVEMLPYATNQWRLIRHTPAKSRRSPRLITADNASWTPTASGTVATNTYTSGVRKQQVAATTAGVARAVFTTGTEANYLPGSMTTVNYSKAFRLRFTAQVFLPPSTPATSRITIHLAGILSPTHDLTERGLALQWLGNGTSPTVRIQSYDTGITNGTAVTQTAQDASPHDYEFVWLPGTGGGGYLLIDGNLVASITTGLASGNGTPGSTRAALVTENVVSATDSALLRLFSPISIEPLE